MDEIIEWVGWILYKNGGYSQDSICGTPISVISSYMLGKFDSPTKTQLVRLVSVMC